MDHDQGQLAAFLAACAQALAFQALAQAVGVVHIAEGRHLEHEIIQGRAVRRRLGLGRGRRFFGSGLGRALGGIAPGRQSVVRRLVERIRALGGRGRGRCGGCVGSGRGAANGLPAQVGQFVAQARVFGTGHGLVHLGQGLPVGTADAGQLPHLFAGVLAVAHHIAHEEGPAYAGQHEGASLFEGMTKSGMLYTLLAYDLDSYIDWETGKCSFDSEDFQKVLEFVNTFPEEYDWQNDDRSTPAKIQSGEVLLNMTGIYQLNSIQEEEAMFGEPVTYIGYPTSGGGSGTYMQASELYAITAKSSNKDGAWAFIENYLNQPFDDLYSYGLPARKSALDDMVEKALNVTYMTDENGEQILDENGNPIPEDGTSGISYGDWEYTYHTPTEEEIDILKDLISVAEPSSATGNDEITNIITEEAEAFFKGQKSVADVANVIQSRVQVYVNENR